MHGTLFVPVSRKSTQRLHCSKFSLDTATFTKQVGFKCELLPVAPRNLREVAKFSSIATS